MNSTSAISEDFRGKMTDLYDKGTVIELESTDKKDILVYIMYSNFHYHFFNITPNNKAFGKRTLWGEDSEYCEWAIKSAKKIGKLNDADLQAIILRPEKAGKLIETMISDKK